MTRGARSFRTDQPASAPGKHSIFKAVPWFIMVFFALAALGLGVDLRVIGQAGDRVTAAVTAFATFAMSSRLDVSIWLNDLNL